MTLPDPDAYDREMQKALQQFGAELSREHDWRRGAPRWALVGIVGVLLVALGSMVTRVMGSDERERARIFKALEDQGKWNDWMQGRVSTVETGLARNGDDLGRAVGIIEEMRKDQLKELREQARDRGDERAVAGYEKKLKALNEAKGGQ